jgi:SP family galactose:H+ symporter-like MFS transporter
MAQSSHQVEPTAAAFSTGPAILIAAIAALGGLLFGYDTGVVSGAELFFTKDFHLSAGSEELAVSAVLIGAIIGAGVAGQLADAFGRRLTIIMMAIIFAIGAILTAIAPNLALFVIFRIVIGFGIGAAAVVAPMFIAEMAPPAIRGALVSFNQLAITVGILVAYLVDLAFAAAGMGWRPMFAVAVIPSALLAIGMLFLTDTPRWFASKGRWDEAHHSLARVIGPDAAEKEMRHIRKSLEGEKAIPWIARVRQLLRPGIRWALIVGVGLAVLQQFVGINTVIYYAPTIFQIAGFKTASTAILATTVVGVVNVLFTIMAIFLVDRLGRRPLLLIGAAGMLITLTAIGIIFAIGPSKAAYFILVCVLLYIVSFAISMGPVFWLMSSEIFPNRLRGTGASLSTVANWSANLLISITFLSLLHAAGNALTFWIYAFLALVTLAFVWFIVPETKGKSLEQIEAYWRYGRHWVAASEAEEELRGQNSAVDNAS